MKSTSRSYILYGGIALSACIVILTVLKYLYLWTEPLPEKFLVNADETERQFFYHFYNWFWEARPGFLLHIIPGGIALAVGPLQFLKRSSSSWFYLHEIPGYIYFISVFLSSSGGMSIALDAMGGAVARTGFFTASLLWMGTLLASGYFLFMQNYSSHSVWMKINFSLTFAAVTLRLEQPLLNVLGFDTITAYQIVSWVSWLPNLIFAFAYTNPFAVHFLKKQKEGI
ncbi:MAG: DUF2306 domain-containing protein [Spirochaetia bacterium]|nr:DUF2306 domain-containing protein [Spirochaetia bacterium]